MSHAATLSHPVPARSPPPPALDIAATVHPADWARLPETLRRRFAPRHAPARYAATVRFERSTIGAVFALLATPFRSPLPRHNGVDLPVTVDVRTEGPGVSWSRRVGAAGTLVRSVKSAGPAGTVLERTDGGLGMVLDVSVDTSPDNSAGGPALVFTSRSFFLSLGRWRLPLPALLTPGRCRVEHRAVDADRFRFTLTMTHPLWGTTFRQTGLFTTRECQP